MTSLRRSAAVIAALGVSMALAPALAAGALPKAEWWWTLVVSTSNPNTLVLGTNNGLLRSTDAGKTWHPDGLSGVDATSLVQAGDVLFVGGVRKPPTAKAVVVEGHTYTIPPGAGVLATSTDGGATWRQLHPRGLPSLNIQALAAAGASSDKGLYVLLRTGGLYRSVDGGRSFRVVTPKIGGPAWALAITQNNHFVAGDMATGNYVSAGGAQWQHTSFTDRKGGAMVMEYAVQPKNPERVLMTSYGVEMSSDGGKTWHVVLNSKVMFGPVAWSPSTPDVAYAIGWDRSVWRSTNGGKVWTRSS